MKNKFYKVLLIIIPVFFGLVAPQNVYAFCNGAEPCNSDADCAFCCKDYLPNCSYSCSGAIGNPNNHCNWSVGNRCTDWCGWSPCYRQSDGGYMQTRYCCDGINTSDMEIRECGGGGPPVSYNLGARLFVDLNGNGVVDSFESKDQAGLFDQNPDCHWVHDQPWASNFNWWNSQPPGWGGGWLSHLPYDNNNWRSHSYILSSNKYDICNTYNCFPVAKGPITISLYDPFVHDYQDLPYPRDWTCGNSCGCAPAWGLGIGWSHTTAYNPYILKPKDGENWRILKIMFCTGNGIPSCKLESDGSVHVWNVADGASTAVDLFISTNNPTPTPQPAGAWWQVKDSDVQSAGDLTSSVPTGNYFDILGIGGFPGIPAYGGSTNLSGANVSPTGWLVNSAVTNSKTYSYDYFASLIPSDITAGMNSVDIADVAGSLTTGGTPDTNNYYWYKYDGAANGNQPLTIPSLALGTRKVILMVDNADLDITGNINLTAGQGFFMVIVKGNINIDQGVGGGGANLTGLYFADGTFSDGVGSSQLWVRGSVVANSGVNLQRDLGATDNATTPSELFAYAPDQIMLFPKVLGTRKINWKEVAP